MAALLPSSVIDDDEDKRGDDNNCYQSEQDLSQLSM